MRQRIPVLESAFRHNNLDPAGTYELGVSDELSCEPEERLLEVVVGLCRNVVVLEVLLAVEGDGLGLDLALLDINLVAGENDGDVFADTDEIAWVVALVVCSAALQSWIESYGASWGRSCR